MPTLTLTRDPPLDAWPRTGLVAILDLEFTAWEGSLQRDWGGAEEWREIVQIGILLADAGDGFAIRDEYEVMVRPRRHAILSSYFVSLTGITQSRLDAEAVELSRALPGVAEFAARAECVIFNGRDGEVLRENCELAGQDSPVPADRMFNFRPLLARTLSCQPDVLTSSDLPKLAGIAIEGRAHTALHDCRSIVAAFGVWRSVGLL
jgi:inhibitor of KinA sporulation pathway (predicted exonuclease)